MVFYEVIIYVISFAVIHMLSLMLILHSFVFQNYLYFAEP